MSDPSTRASASSLKARFSKWKETANSTPQKKAMKTTGRTAGGIKINEPIPKTTASTPPLGPLTHPEILISECEPFFPQET
jgi:hypothetical protein